LEFGGKLNWQVRRLRSLQDAVNVTCRAAVQVLLLDSIGDQSARTHHVPIGIDGWNVVARGKRNDQVEIVSCEDIGQDNQAHIRLRGKRIDDAFDLFAGVNRGYDRLDSERARRRCEWFDMICVIRRRIRIEQDYGMTDIRRNLLEDFGPLAAKRG